MIRITSKGDFSKATRWLERAKEKLRMGILDKYGEEGVEALSNATPVDSGATASSWRYEIQNSSTGAKLSFHNDNINKGVNIAIIIQYGHGTGTGGWVEGRDYINPVIQPLFEKIAEEVAKEVARI